MKKNVLTAILAVIIGSGALVAQQNQKKAENKIPKNVLVAFKKDYPNVKTVKWDEEHDHYEAEFKNTSVTYSSAGKRLETKIEMEVKNLPKRVKTYILRNNLGKIEGASKIVNAKGTLIYKVEVERGDAIFDQNGKFLKIIED